MMKSIFSLVLVFSILIPLKSGAQENIVSITFNKNIELVGYIIHLGDPDDNDPNHPITVELNKWPDDKQSVALSDIYKIAGDMDYSTIIQLFYFVPAFPLPEGYEVPISVINSLHFESESEVNQIRTLVNKVNQFSIESGFEALWKNLEPFRRDVLTTIDKNKPSDTLLTKMEAFYQREFPSYRIVPSLTLWAGPGWGFTTSDRTATFILGPLEKNYDFTNKTLLQTLSVHEFGHSFVDSTVLKQGKMAIPETEALFAPIQENMTRQGYHVWESSVVEHFVRAGEVIIVESMGDGDTRRSEQLRHEYVEKRKFIYLPFIIDRMKYYRFEKEYDFPKSVKRTFLDLQKKYTE